MHNTSRLLISGLSGSCGKTLVSLALSYAFTLRGFTVQSFKKGPDYIDAAWLAYLSGSRQVNLDSYFSEAEQLSQSVARHEKYADISLIEGNRGLFDGVDILGSHSSAALAKLIAAPTLLVLDVSKMTRTAAALVYGCQHMDPELNIAGVILNKLGTKRQEQLIRACIEKENKIPVLGAIPRCVEYELREGHECLLSASPSLHNYSKVLTCSELVGKHIDIEAVLKLIGKCEEKEQLQRQKTVSSEQKQKSSHDYAEKQFSSQMLPNFLLQQEPQEQQAQQNQQRMQVQEQQQTQQMQLNPQRMQSQVQQYQQQAQQNQQQVQQQEQQKRSCASSENFFSQQHIRRPKKRLGVFYDPALFALYPENLSALTGEGVALVKLSIFEDFLWNDYDALYLPGGNIRPHLSKISQSPALKSLKLAAENIPIYAEGDGFACLSRSISVKEKNYPMGSVFPIHLQQEKRPQALGYSYIKVHKKNAFFPVQEYFKAHAFHFFSCKHIIDESMFVWQLEKGYGFTIQDTTYDGLLYKDCFGAFNQIYAPALTNWARHFIKRIQ